MDYKKLLVKYLAHVADVNGDTLTYNVKRETEQHKFKEKLLPFFSTEEEEELDKCEKEAFETFKDIH
jgi:hypothetical protein